jgi:hypothetical protein
MGEDSKVSELKRTVEGLWRVCCSALGEDHLVTQAFETALRSEDADLMMRSIQLFSACPEALKRKVLWGEPPALEGGGFGLA